MNPAEVLWSRRQFDLIALNGVWGIPRSGLEFQKVSQHELALIKVVPWNDALKGYVPMGQNQAVTQKSWRRYQQVDFETIAQRFVAAGIQLTDPKSLLKD